MSVLQKLRKSQRAKLGRKLLAHPVLGLMLVGLLLNFKTKIPQHCQ